jgi:hypothetical protein
MGSVAVRDMNAVPPENKSRLLRLSQFTHVLALIPPSLCIVVDARLYLRCSIALQVGVAGCRDDRNNDYQCALPEA